MTTDKKDDGGPASSNDELVKVTSEVVCIRFGRQPELSGESAEILGRQFYAYITERGIAPENKP